MPRLSWLFGFFLVLTCCFHPLVASADSTSTLLLSATPASPHAGDTVSLTVSLNSSSVAASGVGVSLSYSGGLTYVSTSFTGSVFDTSVAAPTASANTVTFTRVRTDTGYTGSSGLVATLTFTATQSGQQTFTIDQSKSQVISYSDSTNILQDVVGTSLVVSGGTAAILTQTGINVSAFAVLAALLTGGAFYLSRRKVTR